MQYSGFFNGEAEYGQEEFNRYFANLYRSGVSIDDSGFMTLGVTAGAGKVAVSPGFAILNGFYYYNDSDYDIEILPDTDYNRIDRVVVQVDQFTGPAGLSVKKGTPGSSPVPPSITRDDSTYEISLAQVTVTPAGGIAVKDERFDQAVCGAIRPKNLTEYPSMVAEFQKQWEAWFASQQGTGWRNIYIQEGEPGEAVAGSIWIALRP